MTNWKREDHLALECVIENTGSKLCPIVSVLANGTMTCYGEDGQYIRGPAKGNLTKVHPCDNLREGDLVMVWDNSEEVADLRTFMMLTYHSGILQVYTVNSIGGARYNHGLPLQEWKDRNLQEACHDSSALETSE